MVEPRRRKEEDAPLDGVRILIVESGYYADIADTLLAGAKRALEAAFAEEIPAFRSKYPSLPPQQGNRLHCIAWSELLTQPRVERRWGIRFDMNYYYWPPEWANGRSGFMTGSGLPMHFSDLKGDLIDVYQQETHLVDEVFSPYPEAVAGLLDRALGPEGYFGAFGTHSDFHDDFDLRLINVAIDRHVPMVSAQQMLDWIQIAKLSGISSLGLWCKRNLRSVAVIMDRDDPI